MFALDARFLANELNYEVRRKVHTAMNPLFALLYWLLQLYQMILLARVLMSWIPNLDPNNPIARILYQLTEPVLAPIRSALPPMGGIDLSPLVVFLGIFILMQLV